MLTRRTLFHVAGGAATLPARLAWAQGYPTRPVRLIVPVAPGGTSDILARLMGQWLSDRLRQSFIIENRAGAGNSICTPAGARSPADGYSLLLCGVPNATNATIYDKLSYNFIRDVAPVGGVIRGPYVMVVNPSLPTKSVPDFIVYAEANPRKVNMAATGTGTGDHIARDLFTMIPRIA